MSASLIQAQQYMSLYGLSTFYIFGTIGNALLICILTQRTHRQNSCSLYLLAATVVNFILIQCILPLGVYAGNHVDPQNYSMIWCKIRSYLFNALLMLYRWYKMAACVDRAAMCNHRAWVRSFSTARMAYRAIIIITVVWLLIPIHLAFYFENYTGRCIPQPGLYAKLFSAYSIVISGWSPPIVMAIFGIISYRNLKKVKGHYSNACVIIFILLELFQVRARVIPGNLVNVLGNNHQYMGRRDQQLIVLLICEILVYISTNFLFSINITYGAITSNEVKSLERLRIEGFISFFATPFLVIINNCIPFYLYLMVSSKFRNDVKSFFLYLCHWNRREDEQNTNDPRANNFGSTTVRQGRVARSHSRKN